MLGTSDGAPATAAIAGMQKRVRWGQPQVVTPVDQNVLGFNPDFVYVGGQISDASSKNAWSIAPGVTFSTTVAGVGMVQNGVASAATRLGLNTASKNECTFIIVFTKTSSVAWASICQLGTSGYRFIIADRSGNGNNIGVSIAGLTDLAYVTIPNGVPYVFIASVNAAGSYVLAKPLFGSGQLFGTATGAAGYYASNGTAVVGPDNFNGNVSLVVSAFRYLNIDVAKKILANPYQIFQAPSSCVWVAA